MNESLKKEIRILMFKINPLRINYSVNRLFRKIGMYNILIKYKVSEEFLRYYIDKRYIAGYEWGTIVGYQVLSENFIREFQDRLDWMWVCIHQKLSESFMREMKDKVMWNYAAENQKMSDEFILEFYDRINYYCLVKNRHKDMKKFSDSLMDKLYLKINEVVFKKTFVKTKKIDRERFAELKYQNTIHSRFEILDIR